MNEEEIKILEHAIALHGANAQIDVAIEELAELIKAIIKFRRSIHNLNFIPRDVNTDKVSEEIADVEIMIQQLKMIFRNDEKVERFKQEKIERLDRRMKPK